MSNHPGKAKGLSRRELLALGWFPFFRSKYTRMGGARFRIYRNGHSNRRYLMIHGNEESARAVLVSHIAVHPGIAYIVQGHKRNVMVEGLELDPNRMFSREGAEASLHRLNSNPNPRLVAKALERLDRERPGLVRKLTPPPGGLTFALHNNSAGYNMTDEIPVSDRTSLPEPQNPRAFFLCTHPRDFEILRKSPYNVLLQEHPRGADDGSLSRLAAARGFRYVNLEVALGQTDRQREMVWWLEWNLP